MPIQWPEPFGLSMAEAMACGTPVIAFRRGSVPEVIKDGKTGFIVDNSAEMIMSIGKLGSIRRKDCRDHVVKNFTHEIMVDNYERVLNEIVSKKTKKSVSRKPSRKLYDDISNISRRLIGDSDIRR